MDSTRMSSSVDMGHELAMTCHSSDAVGNCLVEVAHHLQRALALGCLQLETAWPSTWVSCFYTPA